MAFILTNCNYIKLRKVDFLVIFCSIKYNLLLYIGIMENKRKVWQEWEDLVLEYYESNSYEVLDTNYTVPNGEIDIVVQKDGEIVFVEVKVVDEMDDLMWYIKPKKLHFLERTIQNYMHKKNLDFSIRLDVAFVKNNVILEVFENVTNS